jgi:hypothetical protein
MAEHNRLVLLSEQGESMLIALSGALSGESRGYVFLEPKKSVESRHGHAFKKG